MERTLQIDGTSEQIESAKQLVNQVISEVFAHGSLSLIWHWLACLLCATCQTYLFRTTCFLSHFAFPFILFDVCVCLFHYPYYYAKISLVPFNIILNCAHNSNYAGLFQFFCWIAVICSILVILL